MATSKGFVIMVTSQSLGGEDVELGEALTIRFLSELAGSSVMPEKMMFLNSGVKLMTDDSPALPQLRKLEAAGVEIQACGGHISSLRTFGHLGLRLPNLPYFADQIRAGL